MNWSEVFHDITSRHDFKAMHDFLEKEYSTKTVYPDKENIYQAFDLTPFDKVKVVIIGQDPYHGPKQAHGLAFQCSQKENFRHLYAICIRWKTISDADVRYRICKTGPESVFCLNTVLTVRKRRSSLTP